LALPWRTADPSIEDIMTLPLNLTILRMVQDFGKIPRGLLYEKVTASNDEIDKQVNELVDKGALKISGDHIESTDR
jgi:hypothetical protein